MKRLTWFRPLALLLALGLLAAACGGDDGDSDDAGDDGGDTSTEELAVVPGFDGTTIRVAALTPDSGPVSVIGKPLTNGNRAYFNYINSQGGIAGKYPIELVVGDTAYDRTQAATKYGELEGDVVMVAQLLGTAIVDALLGDLEDDDMIAVPASLDSKWVREPNLLPVGGPYQIQAINSIDWYYSQAENEGQTLCTVGSDDEYGDAGNEGVQFIADELGIDVAAKATFPAPGPQRPAQNFQAQIAELSGANCEVVFVIATPSDMAALATTLAETPSFAPKKIIGQSPTWIGAFAANPYLQANFLLASEGTEFGDTSVPGMAQLTEVIGNPELSGEQQPDIYFNFGYVSAIATVALLEKAVENGDLSREGLLEALEDLGTVSFSGLTGDYEYGAADDRVPPVRSSIYKPNPAKGGGLEIVERDYEAEIAKDFEFE